MESAIFLCSVIIVVYLHGFTVGSQTECTDGVVVVTSSTLETCYWIVQSRQNIQRSENHCAQDGGHLGVIPNQSISDIVYAYVSNTVYGSIWVYLGYDEKNAGVTVRHTGQQQMWTNWDSMEPNNYLPSESCIGMYLSNGKWHDIPCYWTLRALCSKSAPIGTTTGGLTASNISTWESGSSNETIQVTAGINTTREQTTFQGPTTTTTTMEPTTTNNAEYLTTSATTTQEQTTMNPTTTTTHQEPTTTSSSSQDSANSTTTQEPTTSTITQKLITATPIMETTTTPSEDLTTLVSSPVSSKTKEPMSTLNSIVNITAPICCVCQYSQINYTTSELEAKLENLKEETKVDTETLSSTIRKKKCADDPRPSAAHVGYVGIGILVSISIGMLLPDILTLINKVFKM